MTLDEIAFLMRTARARQPRPTRVYPLLLAAGLCALCAVMARTAMLRGPSEAAATSSLGAQTSQPP